MTTMTELITNIEDEVITNKEHQARLQAEMATADKNDPRYVAMFRDIETAKAAQRRLNSKLDNARKAQAEDGEADRLNKQVRDNPGLPAEHYAKQDRTERMHVTSEPRTYSRDKDPMVRGDAFIADILGSFRGDATSTERLARHQHEWEVDNPHRQMRAAGDSLVANFPNLVIPQYIVSEYLEVPNNARPYADRMRKVPLSDEGMTVELAVGNSTASAALQTTELVAVSGTSHDDNPLELNVLTAESWQNVSVQAIQRGRATQNILLSDMMEQIDACVDDTVLNQATYGLFAKSQRNEYDDAGPVVSALYPKIIAAASVSQGVLKNRGKPNTILMHPRRYYWMAAAVGTSVPFLGEPGIRQGLGGEVTNNEYGKGVQGLFPVGLDVITDYNINTIILDGAATGGTEDCIIVGDSSKSVLLEQPTYYIRAEQPLATQLGIQLICYKFFAYTHAQLANAFQRIDGTGTVAPAGF